MTAKTPTAQAVSAMLSRHGLGYVVSVSQEAATVRVRYCARTEGAGPAPEYVRAKTGQCAEVIRKAGYAAERGDNPANLIVSRACGATAYRPGPGSEMTACWLPETPHVWHESEYGRFDWDERDDPREG
jgi:hypothetical protein